MLDIVPASRTVLIKLAGTRYQGPTRQRLGKLDVVAASESAEPAGAVQIDVHIDVVYDGPDLDDVARLTGMSADQVVAVAYRRTVARRIRRLRTGFRISDRGMHDSRSPAGRAAHQGPGRGGGSRRPVQRGLSPRVSGGWQLIGRTADGQAALWDVERDPPALLIPGMWVQFRAVG